MPSGWQAPHRRDRRRFHPAHAFGIDYALMGMFLCLLVYQLRGRLYVLTGLIAGRPP